MRIHVSMLFAAATLGPAPPGFADHATDELSEVVVTARAWEAAAGAAMLNELDLRPLRAATSDSAALLRGIAGEPGRRQHRWNHSG